MVGFIEDDEIPGFGVQEFLHSFFAANEMAGGEDEVLAVPGIGCEGRSLAEGIAEFALGEAPEVEIEFFAQFVLPLGLDAGGGEDEDALGFLGKGEVAENQARFDRLTQSDFIGDQVVAREGGGYRSEDFDLVNPGFDGDGFDGEVEDAGVFVEVGELLELLAFGFESFGVERRSRDRFGYWNLVGWQLRWWDGSQVSFLGGLPFWSLSGEVAEESAFGGFRDVEDADVGHFIFPKLREPIALQFHAL